MRKTATHRPPVGVGRKTCTTIKALGATLHSANWLLACDSTMTRPTPWSRLELPANEYASAPNANTKAVDEWSTPIGSLPCSAGTLSMLGIRKILPVTPRNHADYPMQPAPSSTQAAGRSKCPMRVALRRRTRNSHITEHLPQQPASPSRSSISILSWGPFCAPLPPGYPDISLLYFRISRTMSKKALSTFIRDFADVSMNLQPNDRASALPSA